MLSKLGKFRKYLTFSTSPAYYLVIGALWVFAAILQTFDPYRGMGGTILLASFGNIHLSVGVILLILEQERSKKG